jgi:hypothetical protein
MDVHFVSDEAIEQHPVGELASEQRCDRWRSGVVTWAHSTAAAELHGDYCGGAAVQEDICLPVGELRLQESG